MKEAFCGCSMIEWERVNELGSEIGEENLAEVIELFLQEADEVIARLAPEASAASLEADLHFLKGAALNLGFRDFARLCQDGERRAASGDNGVDLGAVKACYGASKAALAAGNGAASAA